MGVSLEAASARHRFAAPQESPQPADAGFLGSPTRRGSDWTASSPPPNRTYAGANGPLHERVADSAQQARAGASNAKPASVATSSGGAPRPISKAAIGFLIEPPSADTIPTPRTCVSPCRRCGSVHAIAACPALDVSAVRIDAPPASK